jgi:hypothetical protein
MKSSGKEGGAGEKGRQETFGRWRQIQSKKTGAGAGLTSREERRPSRGLVNGNEHSVRSFFSSQEGSSAYWAREWKWALAGSLAY